MRLKVFRELSPFDLILGRLNTRGYIIIYHGKGLGPSFEKLEFPSLNGALGSVEIDGVVLKKMKMWTGELKIVLS